MYGIEYSLGCDSTSNSIGENNFKTKVNYFIALTYLVMRRTAIQAVIAMAKVIYSV